MILEYYHGKIYISTIFNIKDITMDLFTFDSIKKNEFFYINYTSNL